MPAETPTILATSGGLLPDPRTFIRPGPLLDHALELARPAGTPRLCFVNTAGGDQAWWNGALHAAYYGREVIVSCLSLFPMPNVADPAAHLLAQDAVWVGGGSTANLLALWRLHGLDRALRRCWRSGVVLAGVSAGSICWHVGGTTDSFGPHLQPVTNGLGFLPWSNGVHYDAEDERRPLFHRLVADGTLPSGYATDNGVGLVYREGEMVEAVSEVAGKAAYRVDAGPDATALETRIEPRLLPGALGESAPSVRASTR
ncbi:MAG: Type 1 glutamine amidotransferase-like domain-containing protein [Acidimicrobiales bacterium]